MISTIFEDLFCSLFPSQWYFYPFTMSVPVQMMDGRVSAQSYACKSFWFQQLDTNSTTMAQF